MLHFDSFQISGDVNIVLDALVQVLSRLRNNIFRSSDSGFGNKLPVPVVAYAGSASMMQPGYGLRPDKGSVRGPYPVGFYGIEHGAYEPDQGSNGKNVNESRRRQ